MPKIVEKYGKTLAISKEELRELISEGLKKVGMPTKKVLLIPPDMTRLNSQAGLISAIIYELLAPRGVQVDIIPALGTHAPMTEKEIRTMFGPDIPLDRFLVHDWRQDISLRGVVPAAKIKEWSEGKLDYTVNVEVNKVVFNDYELILSIGQIVPHEVVGMANYTKNLMVGIGGQDMINKSHFLGAVYNMERIMGRADTPVRKLFNFGVETFLGNLPIHYLLTVMARNPQTGRMDMKGFWMGDDDEAFQAGCQLSREVNLELLDRPLTKVVVYLDPEEFKSTWLGNKAVYRTRMAIADRGELLILAPGLKEFGEDREIDRLIRKYGYRGTPAVLAAVEKNQDLKANLSAAAHLIHGSSEGRFKITYCPGPKISREEIRSVGFEYADLAEVSKKYDPLQLKDGFNKMPDGEKIFYIRNPALGLWALKKRFAAD
jgi:nickel-dependent lactate racemase